MLDVITLTCPKCGGKLNITNEIERFSCGYCGAEHLVNRGGGIVSLSPVVEKLNNIQGGIDKTASELAIKRLQEEIQNLEKQIQASSPKSSSATSLFLILVSFFGIAISLSLAQSNENAMYAIGGIAICVILFILGLRQSRQDVTNHKLRMEEFKKQPIFVEYEHKKEELAKHQNLVRS